MAEESIRFGERIGLSNDRYVGHIIRSWARSQLEQGGLDDVGAVLALRDLAHGC
jgi:hypothetical protein